MVRKEYVVEEITKIMSDLDNIRNVAIIAHVHHGKTTLTDSLLARAGLISKAVAGDVLYTNYEAIEKDRRMTIKSANISLGFVYNEKDYIINLIDTPGHVDFGGHVTRSMRAVDGVVLVVDPVEGVMPQTETVLRQALKEKAKPVLFVNKVDRLLTELRLTPEQTFERLLKLINDINKLISQFAPEEFAEKWQVSVEKGSVAFGSAAKKWAISKPIMDKYKVTFKDIFALTAAGDEKKLQEVAPIDESTLIMMIEHLPSPHVAQRYRIPQIWHGDLESPDGKSMLNTDASANTNIVVFNMVYDPHSGEVPVGRVFSGVAKKGTELHISGLANTQKIQQVGIYMGPDRVQVDAIPAGNIAALIGLKDVSIGDTLSTGIIDPFEQITHYSKPVVTKAVEAEDSRDTTKLIEALRELSKQDPTILTEINQQTGEHLVSGMGELHLEVIETKLRDEFKIPIITSPPIVIYRETITSKAGPIEGKTPNKHSKFYVTVEPLPEGVQNAIDEGTIREGKPKGQAAIEAMVAAGLDRLIAKNVEDVSNKCMLADVTHGVQYMNEVMELLIDGFREAVKDGPLARERCSGVLVSVVDATIHEDPVHRGPAQIIPAIRNAVYAGMLTAGVMLYEPKQNFTINIPQEYMSGVITFVQSKRGQVVSVTQENEQVSIVAKMPVAETLKGFSNDLRGLTQGRAIWYTEFAGYEKLPTELQNKVVREIRQRKGQNPEPPTPDQFMS
ncbi:Elongation factor 2 [Candidatus Micrarchaeum sp.]|uniref:elongation factor EF-2 n=1 Tax=Candidatus Micrarchaeum sp. TaxID=2282148 RepID=UPI000B68AB65|nr:elongation factor EF-2 [Candidatus Micrarchaeum sp.]OWP53810.1 MAG: elongation factor EF-2 [Thermoplasmatales archaeon ARMAN]QRF74509.1 Elongation factor 2 [Candidatus Micrarchaeum sp.]